MLTRMFEHQLLFGSTFEWSDGFAHQMLSHCAVLHAVRLVLNLAPFVMTGLSLVHSWPTLQKLLETKPLWKIYYQEYASPKEVEKQYQTMRLWLVKPMLIK